MEGAAVRANSCVRARERKALRNRRCRSIGRENTNWLATRCLLPAAAVVTASHAASSSSCDDSANKMAFCALAISLGRAALRMRQSETTGVYSVLALSDAHFVMVCVRECACVCVRARLLCAVLVVVVV